MRTSIVLGSLLAAVGIVVALVLMWSGSKTRSSAGSTWSNDATRLAAGVPLFRTIERASWTVEIDADRSGGLLPGPSAYATLGFAKVDSVTISDLAALGKQANDGQATQTVVQHLSDIGVVQSGRKWVRIVGIDRELIAKTKYHRGEILVDESANFVFFRLIAD